MSFRAGVDRVIFKRLMFTVGNGREGNIIRPGMLKENWCFGVEPILKPEDWRNYGTKWTISQIGILKLLPTPSDCVSQYTGYEKSNCRKTIKYAKSTYRVQEALLDI